MPMKQNSEAGFTLLEFIQDVGIPYTIHADDAKELMKGKWCEVCRDPGIKQTQTEPCIPFQNKKKIKGIEKMWIRRRELNNMNFFEYYEFSK